jgi:sugar phosphate isomerase/epimerase
VTFGLNLSFCVKRWVTPELWTRVVRDELNIDLVQFSFDLVDPTWPDDLIDELADDLRDRAAARGIRVHSAFIGLAHYTYNQLLHPNPNVRDVAEAWLGRAYRFCARAGIRGAGGPAGAAASRADGAEADALSERDYADLVGRLHRLAESAAALGLKELYLEPTPLRREWPWTVDQAERLIEDLRGSAVPWRYCLDWGHATIERLYGERTASMEPWLRRLAPDIGALHLQQTDGKLDRHWDFTETGIVDPVAVHNLHAAVGLEDVPVFLEVFYPFERPDREVLEAVRRSCGILKPVFGASA